MKWKAPWAFATFGEGLGDGRLGSFSFISVKLEYRVSKEHFSFWMKYLKHNKDFSFREISD